MLLLTVSSLRNKKRLYSDDYIINNYNNTQDKHFLLCASAGTRYHRLALLKYRPQIVIGIDESFVSLQTYVHAGDPLTQTNTSVTWKLTKVDIC